MRKKKRNRPGPPRTPSKVRNQTKNKIGMNIYMPPTMKDKLNFYAANALGKKAEVAVSNLLQKLSLEVYAPDGLNYDLEFIVDQKKMRCEVKFDRMAKKTGNIAIEFWNSRKNAASGILSTQSNLWFVALGEGFAPEELYVATTKDIMKLYLEGKGIKDIIGGGDGNACFRLFAIPDVIPSVLTRIDDMEEEKLFIFLDRLFKEAQNAQ